MLVFIQLLFPLFLSVLTVGLPFRRICINISRRHGNSICSPNGSCSRIWITIIYEILFWFRVLCVCFVTLCSSMHEMRCHSISLLYVEEALRKPMDFDEVKFAKKKQQQTKTESRSTREQCKRRNISIHRCEHFYSIARMLYTFF